MSVWWCLCTVLLSSYDEVDCLFTPHGSGGGWRRQNALTMEGVSEVQVTPQWNWIISISSTVDGRRSLWLVLSGNGRNLIIQCFSNLSIYACECCNAFCYYCAHERGVWYTEDFRQGYHCNVSTYRLQGLQDATGALYHGLVSNAGSSTLWLDV